MTASFSALGQIAGQPDFQQRVNIAMNEAAINIYNEATTTPGHALRAEFSTKVTNGQYNLIAACNAVLTGSAVMANANPSIPGNGIADADLSTEIAAMWNTLAGA